MIDTLDERNPAPLEIYTCEVLSKNERFSKSSGAWFLPSKVSQRTSYFGYPSIWTPEVYQSQEPTFFELSEWLPASLQFTNSNGLIFYVPHKWFKKNISWKKHPKSKYFFTNLKNHPAKHQLFLDLKKGGHFRLDKNICTPSVFFFGEDFFKKKTQWTNKFILFLMYSSFLII